MGNWLADSSCLKLLSVYLVLYEGGPKNNENFLLEGKGALVSSDPAWCVYGTARRISWPSGVLEETSVGSV